MKNLGLKCRDCGSDDLFFERIDGIADGECRAGVMCDSCFNQHTLVLNYEGVCWETTAKDLNSNMAFNCDDDYDHFAFHADERKQNGN